MILDTPNGSFKQGDTIFYDDPDLGYMGGTIQYDEVQECWELVFEGGSSMGPVEPDFVKGGFNDDKFIEEVDAALRLDLKNRTAPNLKHRGDTQHL